MDLIAATGLIIWFKLDSNRHFWPVWPWNLMDDFENYMAHLLCYAKLCASLQSHRWIRTGVIVQKRLKFGSNWPFFAPCDLEIWGMTSKNSKVPLLFAFKLWASFHSHGWIHAGITVQKRSIWVKISSTRLLQAYVFQQGPNLVKTGAFSSRVTLKFDNRAPLVCHFKLCASFHSHLLIEVGVLVRKPSLRIKIVGVSVRTPLLGYFKLCASFRSHLWIQIGVIIRKSPFWGKICFDVCDLDLWPLTLSCCICISFVQGNNS